MRRRAHDGGPPRGAAADPAVGPALGATSATRAGHRERDNMTRNDATDDASTDATDDASTDATGDSSIDAAGEPNGDATGDASTDATLTRRKFVAGTGAAAGTALAGCHGGGGSSSGPTPDVTLQDVRVVQTVENTEMRNSSTTISDPPIVADEYATVMFDVDVTHPDELPQTVRLGLVSGESAATHDVELHRDDLRAIADGADAPAVFHRRANTGGTGETPPVFEMPADVDQITVGLGVADPNVNGDLATLTEGANEDFEVTTLQTLRVGFIPIKDPGSVLGRTHYHGGFEVHLHTTDIDWGDANGEARNYQRSVASSFEVLKRAYPGQVVAYRHDTHLIGHIRELTNNAAGKDAEEAMKTLNQIRGRSSFPSGGAVLTEDLSRQDAVDLMDADTGGAFDVTVVVVPQGTASGNQGYFDAHWGSNPPAGYHYNFNSAVAANEALTGGDDVWHTHITAQEIGHRFAWPVYSNATARNGSDNVHASADLVSTCYDLTDGTYSLVNDWTVSDGSFSPGSTRTSGGDPTVGKLNSYMSYSGNDHWADSRIHRYLVDGGYSVGYSDGSSPAIAPMAAGVGDESDAGQVNGDQETAETDGGPPTVVQAFGTVEDGRVRFHNSAVYRARAKANAYDPEADAGEVPDEAVPVEVTVEGPSGEVLESVTVPDRHFATHHEVTDAVSASLPFPAMGVSLVADRDGERTRLNPIVDPVRHELDDLPERALVEGEATLGQLFEILVGVEARMDEGQYREAAIALEEQFLPRVQQGVVEYEPYANQPTAEQLVDLAARMAERLHTVAGQLG